MESMIKIDNGVSKKAMDEVAEVVIGLFKAATDYDVGEDNLGRALKLIGKTIKTGPISISNCNLHNTEGMHLGEGSTAVQYGSSGADTETKAGSTTACDLAAQSPQETHAGSVTGLSAAQGIQVP